MGDSTEGNDQNLDPKDTDESSVTAASSNDDDDDLSDDEEENEENSTSQNGDGISSTTLSLQPSGIIEVTDPNNPSFPPIQGTVFDASLLAPSQPQAPGVANVGTPNAIPNTSPSSASYKPPGPGPGRYPTNKSDKIKFKDCGGLEQQVNFLKTAVIDAIRSGNSQKKRFNMDPPKGILFYGPPGTGKTRLAQALGNELTTQLGRPVNFIYRKGMDIANMYFGQSSANLRAVFEEAKSMQPCVLFFDELDGLCPSRDKPYMNQANITIVTTMLGLMDELPKGKVFVIAATNRLESIDPALRRPGRFDKYLEFLPPNQHGRYSILKIHVKDWKQRPEKDFLHRLSHQTNGFSGADLAKLCLDAFDHALSRSIRNGSSNSSRMNRNPNLSGFAVTVEDWKATLAKMKPSNSAVFGSTLYSPPPILGDHLQPLIQEDVETIKEMITKLSSHNKKNSMASYGQHPSTSFLYVWSHTDSSSISFDDLIISEVLRSQKIPIYCIREEMLFSVPVYEWPSKIKYAFSQAAGAGSGILYLQNIAQLWNQIKNNGLSLAIDIKQHLELLRGTSVIVLATGSTKISMLPEDNPLKVALSGAVDACYEIKRPSYLARQNFFTQLFSEMLLGDRQWEERDVLALAEVNEKAVEFTFQKDIASISLLYETIVHDRVNIRDTDEPDTIIRKLLQIIGSYKMRK